VLGENVERDFDIFAIGDRCCCCARSAAAAAAAGTCLFGFDNAQNSLGIFSIFFCKLDRW
jgi:hypothetical protein